MTALSHGSCVGSVELHINSLCELNTHGLRYNEIFAKFRLVGIQDRTVVEKGPYADKYNYV